MLHTSTRVSPGIVFSKVGVEQIQLRRLVRSRYAGDGWIRTTVVSLGRYRRYYARHASSVIVQFSLAALTTKLRPHRKICDSTSPCCYVHATQTAMHETLSLPACGVLS